MTCAIVVDRVICGICQTVEEESELERKKGAFIALVDQASCHVQTHFSFMLVMVYNTKICKHII